jgi:ferredoxin
VLLDRSRRPLARADAWMNRLYGWRYNPLYHSGVLAAALLAAVMVSGIYLLLFYRLGAPYDSVAHVTNDVWLGAWTRSFHRYASDAAIAAALVHMLRILLQRRAWGARAVAWVSGLVLLFSVLICGWTGYVMVWDVQGEVLAREGARFLDALPLFSEPISRAFDGERALPAAFFFLNLFLHVALPIGLAVVFWIHVARVARPQLLPQRGLSYATLGLLALASFVLPVTMAPAADLFRLPGRAPYDLFYAFFLPFTRGAPVWAIWLGTVTLGTLICLVPWLTRPPAEARPGKSVVDERACTGCEQCWIDCPYEAITMVDRTDGRSYQVARVDPDLCTACGICAGSCAPMGVGPPGRTGRDQLRLAPAFVARHAIGPSDVVIVACRSGSGRIGTLERFEGAPVWTVSCAGNLHTSVVEYFVRSGAAGVLVVSCPPRDCWNREGPVWLEQRLFTGREAELQPRVDRRRVRLVHAAEGERDVVRAELLAFRAEVRALGSVAPEGTPDVDRACEVLPEVGPRAARAPSRTALAKGATQ